MAVFLRRPNHVLRWTLLANATYFLLQRQNLTFTTVLGIALLEFAVYISWIYLVYPHFLSPFRNMPRPKVGLQSLTNPA